MSSPQPRNILIDGKVVHNSWHHFCSDSPAPPVDKNQGVIFPFEYTVKNQVEFLANKGPKGVAIGNTDDLSKLRPIIKDLSLICLDFPVATDGRAYSQARVLRQQYGFTNDIRAEGEIEVDQLFLMTRCGINAFVFSDDVDLIQIERHLTPFTVSYQ